MIKTLHDKALPRANYKHIFYLLFLNIYFYKILPYFPNVKLKSKWVYYIILKNYLFEIYLHNVADVATSGNSISVPIMLNTANGSTNALAGFISSLFLKTIHINVGFATIETTKSINE